MVASLSTGRNIRGVVALGGGGARGLAHVGVLEVLLQHDWSIERFVGVSMGAFAGGLCAHDPQVHTWEEKVLQFLQTSELHATSRDFPATQHDPASTAPWGFLGWYLQIKDLFRAHKLLLRLCRYPSLFPATVLERAIETLVPDIDISDTRIPLSIVAVDLRSGNPVVLEHGSLRRAILASAAIPGIFPPVPWGDMLLADVGVVHSLPTKIAAQYAHDLVIGVDVGPQLRPLEKCHSALQVLLRMDEISEQISRPYSLAGADLVIRPAVSHVPWNDFSNPAALIQAGRVAALDALREWQASSSPPPDPSAISAEAITDEEFPGTRTTLPATYPWLAKR